MRTITTALLFVLATAAVAADPPAKPALPPDLALVPADAVGFVTVRTAGLAKRLENLQLGAALANTPSHLGVAFADLERVTIFVSILEAHEFPTFTGLVVTAKPYDRAKVLAALAPKAEAKRHKNKTCYVHEQLGVGLYFVDDRTFLRTGDRDIVEVLEQTEKRREGPLAPALRRAAENHFAVVGLNAAVAARNFRHAFGQQEFPPARVAEAVLDIDQKAQLQLHLTFAKELHAEDGEKLLKNALALGRKQLAALAEDVEDQVGPEHAILRMLGQVDTALKDAVIRRQGTDLSATMTLQSDLPTLNATLSSLWDGSYSTSTFNRSEAEVRAGSAQNLRRLAAAMRRYQDDHGHLPPAAVFGKDGKPLLSWRVLLLPYLGEDALYKEFKLDEPWDSPHNKALAQRMPVVFAPKGVRTQFGNFPATCYRVVVGPGAAFEGKEGLSVKEFRDGAAKTLLIVEAATPVPWTKPGDLRYGPDRRLPRLGMSLFSGGFHVAFADGSIRFFPATTDEKTIRAIITRNGAEKVELPDN